MKDVVVKLDSLRKLTTHPWIQQQTLQETRSLVLEVDQSDLYEVPLISYSTNNTESHSNSTYIVFEENIPR
ncbi:hypothetical protein Hanom_Chr03g00265201 [Helianthus anomalus]